MMEDARASVERLLRRSRRMRRIGPSIAVGSASLVAAGAAGAWVASSVGTTAAATSQGAGVTNAPAAVPAGASATAYAAAALARDVAALDNLTKSITSDQRLIAALPKPTVESGGGGESSSYVASGGTSSAPTASGAASAGVPSGGASSVALPALPPLPPLSLPAAPPPVVATTGATHVVP